MQYQFYLDGQRIYENPIGWDAMTVRVKRDVELKSVLVNLDATLTFTADGYDYIKSIQQSENYCAEIKISIYRSVDNGANFIEKYKGLLYISDMKFDDFNCSVTVKFTDDSFYGRINSRRKTEAFLTGDKTINGEDLTPCLIREAQYFDPVNGSAIGPNGSLIQPLGCYKVFDVLNYLVSYMTDNQVEFSSPLFGPSGDFRNLMLTFGYSIRQTGNGVILTLNDIIRFQPSINFQSLFTELNKRFNIGFFIDLTGAKPKVIIDYWKELFRANKNTTFPDLPNLTTSIAKDFIYSSVKFGGTKFLDLPAASFPAEIPLLGFKSEEFPIKGKCNIENVLDLSYDYVSDPNVIQEILILSGTDDGYDKDWFLIDANAGTGGDLIAIKSNWIGGAPPYFYNERINNQAISENYFGFIPNSIIQYIGPAINDPSFQAQLTLRDPSDGTFLSGTGTEYDPIKYNDDSTPPNFDTNGVYDNVVHEFNSPGSGAFTFYASVNLYVIPETGNHNDINIIFRRFDSFGVFISEFQAYVTSRREVTDLYDYTFIAGTKTIYLAAGDKVRVGLTFSGGTGVLFAPNAVFPNGERSTFRCISGVNAGGIIQQYDPADYPIINNEFVTEIFASQTDAITSDPLSEIEFFINNSNINLAWVDDISIDEFKGTINAKLLSARNRKGVKFPPDLQYVTITGQLPDNPFILDVADYYEHPSGGSSTAVKTYFYKQGDHVIITIPSTYLGCPVNPAVNIYISEFNSVTGAQVNTVYTTTTVDFVINPNCNYIVQLTYDLTQPGFTYPSVLPEVIPPTVKGNNGSANIRIVTGTLADYTFAWSNGATTQLINAPAGNYSCTITYLPGTFDNNVIVFNIEIPISIKGA